MEPDESIGFEREQGEMTNVLKSLDAQGLTMVENGVLRVHPREACAGRRCWVHDPTPSHMDSWPVRWRADKSTAERVCPHGIGHPDIDDIAYNQSIGLDVTTHGCDGCCEPDPRG